MPAMYFFYHREAATSAVAIDGKIQVTYRHLAVNSGKHTTSCFSSSVSCLSEVIYQNTFPAPLFCVSHALKVLQQLFRWIIIPRYLNCVNVQHIFFYHIINNFVKKLFVVEFLSTVDFSGQLYNNVLIPSCK